MLPVVRILAFIGVFFALFAISAQAESVPSRHTESQHERLQAFFDESFEAAVATSPIWQSYLGRKTNYGKWDEISEWQRLQDYNRTQKELETLRSEFNYETLSPEDQLSYRIFEISAEDELRFYKWRHHSYPLNQMFGTHSNVPSFLITVHSIDNKQQAKDYISRLNGVETYFDQLIADLKRREANGVIPPKFVYSHVDGVITNMLDGVPVEDGATKDHPLFKDFKDKVAKLNLTDEETSELIDEARVALQTSFKSAYEKLQAFMDDQSTRADDRAGAWKLPDGNAYYKDRLQHVTTTALTAEEIHQRGLDEVARIHDEMRRLIKEDVGFERTLEAFFELSKTSEQFRYPNTPQAREDYLARAHEYLDGMREKLPEAFNTFPKSELEIRPVEPFREKTAGIGFYQRGTEDGSRPGIFYVNLYNMEDVPKTEIEALTYHEALPGHHMQLSIAQELENIPDFRKHATNFTAYTEGWGLYSELLGKEMGFYTDPYSDFGRLTMELWRAIRLVVDTGIHAKQWTRQEAIDYIKANYPASEGEAVKAAERYIVMPGQATAYKIGMMKIVELREWAKGELGERFDLGEFHDVVLRDGEVPLGVLEDNVKQWVASQQGTPQTLLGDM